MKNYYDILEVSKKASKDTINKIFKIHMKANHPDLFQGDEKLKAEEKSKELTEAYNILSDDAERAKYDAELEAEENNNSQMQEIITENEYLKQVIAQKDAYISKITGNYNNQYQNQYNPNSYQEKENYGTGFNGFTPPGQDNPYEGLSLEELQKLKKEQTKLYYKEKIKEIGIQLLVLVMFLGVLLISLVSSFKDISELFSK